MSSDTQSQFSNTTDTNQLQFSFKNFKDCWGNIGFLTKSHVRDNETSYNDQGKPYKQSIFLENQALDHGFNNILKDYNIQHIKPLYAKQFKEFQ
jgi:hypothetical protein